MMPSFLCYRSLTVLLALAGTAEVALGESTAAPPSPIDTWVQELDADQYETRTAATRQLIDAGLASIQPVVTAILQSGNLEVQIRGLEVLEGLALSEDSELALAAWDALGKIANSRATGVSRRAEESLKSLADVHGEKGAAAVDRARCGSGHCANGTNHHRRGTCQPADGAQDW